MKQVSFIFLYRQFFKRNTIVMKTLTLLSEISFYFSGKIRDLDFFQKYFKTKCCDIELEISQNSVKR